MHGCGQVHCEGSLGRPTDPLNAYRCQADRPGHGKPLSSRLLKNSVLYQGTTLVVPHRMERNLGFSPWNGQYRSKPTPLASETPWPAKIAATGVRETLGSC
jgi:hypothetical protein